jgi:GTPase
MSLQFLDEARIFVKSGTGGDGMVSFRREKYVPHGGPNGGDGGNGGNVALIANPKINTLRAFGRQVHFRAKDGERGGSSNKTGATADDLEIEVPLGTIVRDDDGYIMADLNRPGQRYVVAKGGRGGRGNSRFKNSVQQAPRIAEKGEPGQEFWIQLELKLVADVGIVGVPNAGKSTLLSVISNAKPRIANYPFTTLVPNLGMVRVGYEDMVVADIPGLVEGAHQGVGLGHDFLRHVQRTRILVHLLDGTAENPLADFHQINTELALFDERLRQRPMIVVVNKIDIPEARAALPQIQAEVEKFDYEVMAISAATQENVQELVRRVFRMLETVAEEEPFTFEAEARDDEMPIYSLETDENEFTIEKLHTGAYQVCGQRIERAAAMTYWDYDDALERFQRILEAMGVSEALEKAGVGSGDTVFIGEVELEWSNEFEEYDDEFEDE